MAAALPGDPPSRMSDGTMCGCMGRTIIKYTIVVPVGFDFAVYVVVLDCPVPSVILQGFRVCPLTALGARPMCGHPCGGGPSSKLSGNDTLVAPGVIDHGVRVAIPRRPAPSVILDDPDIRCWPPAQCGRSCGEGGPAN